MAVLLEVGRDVAHDLLRAVGHRPVDAADAVQNRLVDGQGVRVGRGLPVHPDVIEAGRTGARFDVNRDRARVGQTGDQRHVAVRVGRALERDEHRRADGRIEAELIIA